MINGSPLPLASKCNSIGSHDLTNPTRSQAEPTNLDQPNNLVCRWSWLDLAEPLSWQSRRLSSFGPDRVEALPRDPRRFRRLAAPPQQSAPNQSHVPGATRRG